MLLNLECKKIKNKTIYTLMNVSGQLELSLCPAYNILQAKTKTSGLPLFLNAAPCSLFSNVQRLWVTVSWANMFGLIFVRYSRLMQRIISAFERWDLSKRIDPVNSPNWKKNVHWYTSMISYFQWWHHCLCNIRCNKKNCKQVYLLVYQNYECLMLEEH